VSRESKVLIGVGGLAAIGLILALSGRMAVGLVVLAAGLVAGFVGLRLTKPDTTDPFAEARTEADQTNTGTLTPSEPLAPWSPEGGLSAWTPPVDLGPSVAIEPVAELATPVAELEPEPTTAWNDTTWDSTVTWEADPAAAADPVAPPAPLAPAGSGETNPLDDLVGLEALDPIAEVERIDSRESAAADSYTGFTPFDSPVDDIELDIHGNPVNENVTGADDIMAASQATELNLADGEQTELQKLLAKVQIRLSAYE
jgi:hypothetical protein